MRAKELPPKLPMLSPATGTKSNVEPNVPAPGSAVAMICATVTVNRTCRSSTSASPQ
jgi:hypothetical protein